MVDIGLKFVLSAASVLTSSATVTLNLNIFGGQAQFLNLCLTLRALLPTLLRALVTTDVDVGRREHVAKLAKDRLQELQCLGIAATKHFAHHTPMRSNGVRAARATQVGEYVQGTLHVSGHIYLGYHIDVTLSSVANDFATLFLRIVATIRNIVVEAHFTWGNDALLAHTTLLGQVG